MATAAVTPTASVDFGPSGSAYVETANRFDVSVEERALVPMQIRELVIDLFANNESARPDSLLFGAVARPGLRVRKPIPLTVSQEQDNVVVSWDDADEFACGKTTGEALAEFSKNIGDLYVELNDSTVRLGKDLARVRDIMNQYIESYE